MAGPSVSIIIPVYNSERTLGDALQKILQQTYQDFEIVLIDGKSTDKSLEIIARFADVDKRISLISEPDNGIYDAMNKGLALAKGEWALFLGSDDELYDESILGKVLSGNIPIGTNILYGSVRIVGNTSWAEDGTIYDGPFDTKKLLNKNICHQSIFYRIDFIKAEIGFYNPAYRLCADWDFNLRCRAKTPFHYLDLVIARFYAGGESTRTQIDEKFRNEYLQNVLTYFNLSPFDKIVNDPSFIDYYKLTFLQRKANFLRYLINKVQRKLFRNR